MATVGTHSPKCGSIVHIGAGEGGRLTEFLNAPHDRILLVEPLWERARQLHAKASNDSRVRVVEAAVCGGTNAGELKILTAADWTSLREPTELYALFPGMKVVERREVELVAATSLVAELNLEAGQGNRLVLDAPGEEGAIIEALAATDQLELFDTVELNCGNEPLYEGSVPAVSLVEALQVRGYDVHRMNDETDPDRRCWTLQRNPLRIENEELRTRVAALSVRESAASGDLPEAAERLYHESQRIGRPGMLDHARLRIFETELEQLRHELSIAQRRGRLARKGGHASAHVTPLDRELSSADVEQHSQSQLGQDVWVLERTDFKRNGFFVEFGATDGVALSNTWLLEKHFGWDGICAEPNPKFYRQLLENRTCTVDDGCIAASSGKEVEFILAAEFGGIADYAEKDMHADKRSAYKVRGHTVAMKTISLDDFLDKHNAPRKIDYLSIDTEGNEFDILESFPFDKWQINYLTVEHNYSDVRRKLRELLEENGYRCVEREWDDWYECVG